MWKLSQLRHPLRLKQMSVVVPGEKLQTSPHGESNHRCERIPEPHAIDVMPLRTRDRLTRSRVARDEPIEYRRSELRRDGRDLPRRLRATSLRARLDVGADEPATEPAWGDLLHWSCGSGDQCLENRRHIHLVRETEMLEALANAPYIESRLPIELSCCQPLESDCLRVGGVQVGREPAGPSWRRRLCFAHALPLMVEPFADAIEYLAHRIAPRRVTMARARATRNELNGRTITVP